MLWKGVDVNDVKQRNLFIRRNLKFMQHLDEKLFEVDLHSKIPKLSLMDVQLCMYFEVSFTVKIEHNLKTLPIHFNIDFISVFCIRSVTAAFPFVGQL